MDRDVPRTRVVLESVEDRPTVHVRQMQVQRDRPRQIFMRQRECRRAVGRGENLEARLASSGAQDARRGVVLLYDQQRAVIQHDRIPIILDGRRKQYHLLSLLNRTVGFADTDSHSRSRSRSSPAARLGRHCFRRVVHRQIERERAAAVELAANTDLAAQQPRDFAADRQSQAGTAVLAAGCHVHLLEGLKDDLLLVERDADAGVAHGEGQHALCTVQRLHFRAPSLRGNLHA